MKPTIYMNHFNQFKCSAGECPITCCQEWRIGVDDHTHSRWERLSVGEGFVSQHVKKDEAGKYIGLNEKKQCPFLGTDKLCKLVVMEGDEVLSKTCRTFPRQETEHEVHTEYSLDTGCPEVIELINASTTCIQMDGTNVMATEKCFEMRDIIVRVLQQSELTISEALLMSFYNLLEVEETNNATSNYETEAHTEALLKVLRSMSCSQEDMLLESNELFLDVIHNYRKQGLYSTYLETIAEYAEGISGTDQVLLANYEQFLEAFQQYRPLVGKYLALEILANGIVSEGTLGEMTVYFQWLMLSYVVLRQALFLKWSMSTDHTLQYETVRDYMVIMARITGYTQDDLEEYLLSSFQQLKWEWGYAAMILGNFKM